MTVNRRDHGLRQGLDGVERFRLEVRTWCPLSGLNGFQVVARGERPSLAAEQHAADVVDVLGDVVNMPAQLHEQAGTQGVQRFGSVQG